MKKIKGIPLLALVIIFFCGARSDRPRLQRTEKPSHGPTRLHGQAIHQGLPFRVERPGYAPDRILVKFKETLSTQAIRVIIQAYRAESIKHIPGLDVYVLQVPEDLQAEEMVALLGRNPDVAYASLNYRFHIAAVPKPNDPLFSFQYPLFNEGQDLGIPGIPHGKNRADIKALEAWEETKGSPEVTVAVIDTGIDFDHPDLQEKIASGGYDFVNSDNDPTDDNGHGTYVAGIIAAKTNNREGIAGVSWDCMIMPLKAVDEDGSGYVDWLIEAIRYAAENGADVINMSLGFPLPPGQSVPALEDALQYAQAQGLVSVAAAGNESAAVLYPAAYDDYCLAVAATDNLDQRPTWSNFGPEVDVAAPGDNVWSLVPTWYPGLVWKDFSFDPYGYGDGTSASTAFVSGFAALIKSAKPWMTPSEIMAVIRFSADDVNAELYPGKDEFVGYGRINMEKALLPIRLSASR